jgi:hypothetical protein
VKEDVRGTDEFEMGVGDEVIEVEELGINTGESERVLVS